VLLSVILGLLALLSLGLTIWQGIVAWRFPLHRRTPVSPPAPGVTLLKPLKNLDTQTETCLRSWLEQQYPGPVQILFGVASSADPVCGLIERLISSHPGCDARLVICAQNHGPNAKVSTLLGLEPLIRHEIVVVSDADVWVPPDLLANLAVCLQREGVGLACCFYRLAGAASLAGRWEALAANADFWSSVLQSRSLKPLDFALGAVMGVPRQRLLETGGFRPLVQVLADDYQLGQRIAAAGGRIELCPVVVECRSSPMTWHEVWSHQLRWARTIRVCQPLPYFLSILSNAALWPLLWLAAHPGAHSLTVAAVCLGVRWTVAWGCERKLAGHSREHHWWLAPLKDLAQVVIWALAFAGSGIVWRGRRFRVTAGGRLVEPDAVRQK
jgi:ceramide glucosyltransferase